MRPALPILFALLATAACAQSAPEQTLFQLTNQARAQSHLPPLAWDPALARAARAHALRIAQDESRTGAPAQHQYSREPDLVTRAGQAGAHFSSISENVAGNGTTPAEIHQAWMRSPVHRANILDPTLTSVGIAIANSGDTLYAVEDLSRTAATLTPNSAEAQVLQLLRARGIQPNLATQSYQEALRNCNAGTTPQTHPSLIMQWESGDLSHLPPELTQQLPATPPQPPQTAAVAACPPQENNPGFTTYRIAVMIY